MKMKLCLVGLLCLLCGELCAGSAFAAGTGSVEIYRTDYGATNYGSGEQCATISGADRYNIYFRMGQSNTGNHLYRHDGDRLVGWSDNDLVIEPTSGGSVTCRHPSDTTGSPNIDYWLVIRGADGVAYSHKIGDGFATSDSNQSGWDGLSVVFGDDNRIKYSNSKAEKEQSYSFRGDVIEEKAATQDNKLNDITFSIPGDGNRNRGVDFKNVGTNTYTITFVSDGPGGDNAGYFYGVGGVANFRDGKSCRYFANDKHTLNVKDGKTGTSASLTIKDKTKKLTVELSVKNGKIEMKEKKSEYTTGQVDDEYTQYGADGDVVMKTKMTCANSGGAMSLGWIVCPILDWLGDATNNIYNDYVEPSLRVDPKLFTNGNDGVRAGWETFRNIANVLFIILLLVVIFSQLTGVGIDNYGIKKILPKLIVAAVLINLSYVLCLIAVDLSNILGNGLRMMFDTLSSQLGTVTADTLAGLNIGKVDSFGNMGGGDGTGDGTGTTIITGVAILGALVGMAGMIWNDPAILLSLLVAALGVAIAVFFLFVLLAVREAAIVVLVAISPLAVACYMLPNTKKLFDRWLKFFQGLLLVYPICGLLIGGGNYVSTLLLTTQFGAKGFIQAFTAMIVGIVPIFFIPTVLKGSFAAMGKVGATLTGLGTRARGAAAGRIRNSEGFKAAQTRGLERKTRIKAGYDSKGRVTKRGALKARFAGTKVGRAIGYQSLQAARVSTANKGRERDIQANAELRDIDLKYQNSLDPGMSTENILTERLREAADSGDANSIFSVIEQMKRSNMQASHIANATRAILGGRNIGRMSEGQRKNFLEEFGKKYGNDFLKKDFEQAHWARMGGVGVAGASALGGWAVDNIAIDDLKDEDVAALSSDRLNDLIVAGKISQSQAQRVWASNSNTDDTNRLILGAYGNNGMQITKADAQQALGGTYSGTAAGLNADMVGAYTRRAAERTVIEDVDLVNRQGEVGHQTNNLGTDMGGASGVALSDIAANTGQTATNTGQTAANTGRTADGVDEVNAQLRRHTAAAMDAAAVNLDNETLAEVATNPRASMDDPLREAAEREINRRVRDGKMDF